MCPAPAIIGTTQNGVCLGTTKNTIVRYDDLSKNTIYGFKVVAVDDQGILGEYSQNLYVRTYAQLPAPLYPRVTNQTVDSISIDWFIVLGAKKYNIYQNGIFLANANTNSYTFEGLPPDTRYDIQIAAVEADGQEGLLSNHLFIRTSAYLAAPQNLHAAATSMGAITMEWDSVDGRSYYRVYQDEEYIGRTYSTNYTFYNLTKDTIYEFSVVAVDAKGEYGAYSDTVSVKAEGRLFSPLIFDISSKTANSITLVWSSVGYAHHYRIYRDGIYRGNVTETSYTFNNLEPDTVYSFKVAAVDDTGALGAYTNNIFIKTDTKLPRPENLRATDVLYNQITLEWDNVPSASYYQLTQMDFVDQVTTFDVYGTSYTCTGLAYNREYSYSVTAVSSSGIEGYSNYLRVQTANKPDVIEGAPVIESATVTPSAITAPANVLVSISINDNGQTISNVVAELYLENNVIWDDYDLAYNEATGKWETSISFSPYIKAGDCTLYVGVSYLPDPSNTYADYWVNSSFEHALVITNENEDYTRPTFGDFFLDTNQISLSDSVIIHAHVYDNQSGLASVKGVFRTPDWNSYVEVELTYNAISGYWEGTFRPQDWIDQGETNVVSGLYTVFIVATDYADNQSGSESIHLSVQ